MTPTRPCWVEICTRSLEENFRFLQTLAAPHAELLAIVKADGYGHSLALCAPAAVRAGAQWLGVTSVEEGVAARVLCPEAQILVICGVFSGQGEAVVRHGLTTVAWEHWQLDELEAAARKAGANAGSVPVHLEIDTGMNRQGADAGAANGLVSLLARFDSDSSLRLDGVMTHLYAADESDGAVTQEQLVRLDAALAQIAALGFSAERKPQWLNVGNSAALLAGQAGEIAAIANRYGMKALLRPGLALYGLAPRFEMEEPATVAAARMRLQRVLTWKTRVVSVRAVPVGAVVGYNGTFVVTEPMRLALVAVGYGDGLDRRLGNCFSLLVRGERAPIVGRISMDQTVLDVTEIPDVAVGDEVVILGEQDDETISAFDHADSAETIPWEVFTRIAARVIRVAV
jgi:alanine racemase